VAVQIEFVARSHPSLPIDAWLERQFSTVPVELPGDLDSRERDAIEALESSDLAPSIRLACDRSSCVTATVASTIPRGRNPAAGASTPWYVTRCRRGRGTSAHSRSISTCGSSTTCVVPSFQPFVSE
jgi:hypothetical protein